MLRLSATELMIHPRATKIPPNATISFGPRCGPRLSTIQPSIGVSQVSSAMKMVNAIWIAARESKRHPRKSNPQVACASRIGLTNSVHPYCRLAIITMQTMTDTNWAQRVVLDSVDRSDAEAAIVIVASSRGHRASHGVNAPLACGPDSL